MASDATAIAEESEGEPTVAALGADAANQDMPTVPHMEAEQAADEATPMDTE